MSEEFNRSAKRRGTKQIRGSTSGMVGLASNINHIE